jgi:hypothetical protein
MIGHSLENPLGSSFRTGIVTLTFLAAAILWIVVSPIAGGVLLIGAAVVGLTWLVVDRTVPMLGIVLTIMPIDFLAVLLGHFYGLPYMTAISAATKQIPLLLLTFILLWRNGLKFKTPDWFLLAFFTIGLARLGFGGGIRGFIDDFGFLIPYTAGRVTVLTEAQEQLWAKCAVLIAAVLSAAGMIELFILGDGPRKLAYAVMFVEGDLPDSFRASGFEGLREASTMVGPLEFAALCMVALIIWWGYLRNPVPAGLILAGLVCALTRSAWIGTVVAISVLAFRLHQQRRLMSYALLGIIGFAATIPILGIRDYLSFTRTGQEESEQVHSASLLTGLEYVGSHPFGSGPESLGPRIVQRDAAALNIESSYLTLAAEYGVVAGLCFVGFVLAAILRSWRNRTRLGYAGTAILMGFGIMMFVLPIHQDFRLACWVWFPVGLCLKQVECEAWDARRQA